MDASLSLMLHDHVNDVRGQRSGWIAALTLAVMMHVLMLVAVLALHARSDSLQPVSAGHGLRVTLTAAARPVPVALKATPKPTPRPLKPAPSKVVVLASRYSAKRAVATPPTHQADTPVAAPAEASPSESAVSSASAPAEERLVDRTAGADAKAPSLNLPDSKTAVGVAHIECDIPPPPYPPHARRLRQVGVVTIDVAIGTTGRVTRAEIAHSSGYDELDAAARDSMLSAHCKPYVDHDVAVAVHALQSIEFNLNN